MARINPIHSSNQADPDVHHVCSNCDRYQQIPSANRRPGTNGQRLCERCDYLITNGGC